jgi:tRNA (guanine37-N1)-methyltransferase
VRIDVITVLPEVFEPVLAASIIGRARRSGVIDIAVHDLRAWTTDRHRTTDDYAFGGGPGMVMKPEPVFSAVGAVTAMAPASPTVVLLTPQGRVLDQPLVADLASRDRLLVLCGRYEGFDERIRTLADLEISIGDFVLTGGDLPALALIDAVARLQPGVLGTPASAESESFTDGLLEYPQYTRPAVWEGLAVPDVLLSGDHARIAAWRRRESIRRTATRRPDLLACAELTDEEREFAQRVIDGME